MSVDTETLDKLYLEWSQFTKARTNRERNMMVVMQIGVMALNGQNAEKNREIFLAQAASILEREFP